MRSIHVLDDLSQVRHSLLSDFLLFHRVMFEKRTGRPFVMSRPDGNESHFITLARELTDLFNLKYDLLVINIPPGWAKSEFCKSFIAWSMAWYPFCKFLYVSHGFELAVMHTSSIKQTMMMPIYRNLFNVQIRRDSSAKDFFITEQGGTVAAFGIQGGVTGYDAGLPGVDTFSGALLIDDAHKPKEVHSDTTRGNAIRNYVETLVQRLRSPKVPTILIGQRLHEDDLPAYVLNNSSGKKIRTVIIKALDDSGNARYPEVNPKSQLLIMKETQPYVFASQYQQEPMPSGGALFGEDWFKLMDESPEILTTFITVDSAETEKEYNDATVFSFWGLYKIKFNGSTVDDMYGLHWIDCEEIRIEPKDLENAFLDFWTGCMRYKVKPKFAAIEKKSTGVTLISVLKKIQGLRVLSIERSGAINNKGDRFIDMQQYISRKQVSLPTQAKHTRMCIDHMKKITANNTHRWDDIADTCYDAIKIALIDNAIPNIDLPSIDYGAIAKGFGSSNNTMDKLRRAAYSN